ncbi:MAG: type II toxin-antitoxin system Phd/YefM family antitoxin [Candidatus Dependentiae bacterium]
MKKANLHEAKTNLSKLVELVAKGQEVIICKADIPVAKLAAFDSNKKKRELGSWAGKVVIEDDFDILPDDFMGHFQLKTSLKIFHSLPLIK